MASQADRILDFVFRFPGRDDDEIARILKVPQRQGVKSAANWQKLAASDAQRDQREKSRTIRARLFRATRELTSQYQPWSSLTSRGRLYGSETAIAQRI